MSQRLSQTNETTHFDAEITTDLNLRELREGNWFGAPLCASSDDAAPVFALSRRAFLTFGGGALVSLSAPLAVASASAETATEAGDFTLTHDADSAVFAVDGAPRWTIDARRFAGTTGATPKLRVQTPTAKTPTYRITLQNAFFPGTDLRADFTCEIRRHDEIWICKLQMTLGGFATEAPFADWLRSEKPLTSTVDFGTTFVVCEPSDETTLRLCGKGRMTFSPSWLMQLEGEKIAALGNQENELLANEVALRLAEKSEPSLLQSAPHLRTFVMLQRGAHAWQMPLLFAQSHDSARGWNVVAQGEPFDTLCLECGEKRDGTKRHALLASGDDKNGALRFVPTGFHDGTGDSAQLVLCGARLAVGFKRANHHTALLARFGENAWIHTDGCSLHVGAHPTTTPFELTSDGENMSLHCAPSLLAASVSLPDAICETVQFDEAPPLHFSYQNARFRDIEYSMSVENSGFIEVDTRDLPRLKLPFPLPLPRPRRRPTPDETPEPTPTPDETPQENNDNANASNDEAPVIKRRPRVIKPETDIGRVQIDQGNLGVLFPRNLSISVVRPEDLLVLRFEFLNLQLQTGNGAGQLVRAESGKAAYIVVHFPPQNIAEQAFLEPPDNLPNNFGMPVQSRIAGPSRLVFQVPNDAAPIPYSLKDLLRACGEFPLSVTATAQLPKYPFTNIFAVPIEKVTVISKIFGALPSGEKREDRVLVARAQLPPWSVFTRSHAQSEEDVAKAQRQNGQTDTPVKRRPSLGDLFKKLPDVIKNIPKKNDEVLRPQRDDIVVISPGLIFANPKPYAPRLFETAIESPYRLIVSPNSSAGWAHLSELQMRDEGKVAGSRAELWHTRLGVRSANGVDELTSSTRTLRAIWSPDYNAEYDGAGSWPQRAAIGDDSSYRPFRMSLEGWHRHQLVAYTADFSQPKADERFIETKRLMLSSLGAWMDTHFATEVKPRGANIQGKVGASFPGFDLEAWTHRSTMGRDHYVRVVTKGFLFPFGHRASLVQVTERKFVAQPGTSTPTSPGYPIAVLRQRFFIVVREPEKTFPAVGQRFDGRTMPLKKVRITTLVTPNMEVASSKAAVGAQGGSDAISTGDAIWPVSNGARFPFHLVGEDIKGNSSEFTAPLIFVTAADEFCYKKDEMDKVNAAYVKAPEALRQFDGQNIAYAPDTAQNPGTTTYETQSVLFAADTTASTSDANLKAADQPHFYPAFAVIEARVPPVQQLLGDHRPAVIALSPTYVQSAFDGVANKGEVLFEMVKKNDFGLKFPTDKSGGLATPNININALSRKFGPVGGKVEDFALGKFKPEEYFKDMEAKILGGIDLFQILGVPTGFSMGDGKNVPKLVTKLLRNGDGIPIGNRTELNWQPDVKEFLIFQPTSSTKLTLLAVVEAKLDNPAPPKLDITGELTKFQINFFEFIKLNFDLLGFYAKVGKKLDVNAQMESGNEVEFGGPLTFVNTIKKYIPGDGFSDPPSLDISPSGITAGYSLGLPTIAIGVFSLSNVTLGAALTLPFTGDPVRFRFNFCERENPFTLTVSIFGGGGFFGIAVGLDGVEMMEASLEFGGAFAFDIGIASGGVHIMAGVYFKWENDACELTGYLRLGGSLEVLGIITISVEFYMALTYATGGHVVGEATLTVEVEVLFFSTSVSMSVRREFAGSGSGSAFLPEDERRPMPRLAQGDATLFTSSTRSHAEVRATSVRDVMSQSAWTEYCGAFA